MNSRDLVSRPILGGLEQFLKTPYGIKPNATALYKKGVKYLQGKATLTDADFRQFAIAGIANEAKGMAPSFGAKVESDEFYLKGAESRADKIVKDAKAEDKDLGDGIPITNRDDYPIAKWLDEEREIGTVGDEPLYLLGYEFEADPQPIETILVAVESLNGGTYQAIELTTLLSRHEPVSIPNPI